MAHRGRAAGRRQKDPCCVLTAELAPIVRAFVASWALGHADLAAGVGRGGRPAVRGSARDGLGRLRGNDVVGAITVLRERTLLANAELGVMIERDTIRNVINERNRTTELWIADSLLCAIGEAGALNDGRVRVIPNPTASVESRRAAALRGMPECC